MIHVGCHVKSESKNYIRIENDIWQRNLAMKTSSNRINRRSSPMRLYIHNMFVEHDIFLTQRLVLIRYKVTRIWSCELHCRSFIDSAGYRFFPTFVYINSARYLFMLILPIVYSTKTYMYHILYCIFFLMNSI